MLFRNSKIFRQNQNIKFRIVIPTVAERKRWNHRGQRAVPKCKIHVLFLFCFIYLFYFFFYNIVLVLPYIDMNPPWVYMSSPSWTPLPPPSPSHPPGSSQCTSPEHPVSRIKPGLAIRFTYDNIHVSVLFSHIIPPSPSPSESKRLFYTSVSLLLSCIQGYYITLLACEMSAIVW